MYQSLWTRRCSIYTVLYFYKTLKAGSLHQYLPFSSSTTDAYIHSYIHTVWDSTVFNQEVTCSTVTVMQSFLFPGSHSASHIHYILYSVWEYISEQLFPYWTVALGPLLWLDTYKRQPPPLCVSLVLKVCSCILNSLERCSNQTQEVLHLHSHLSE